MKEKINRKKIISNLVEVPESAPVRFWQKEIRDIASEMLILVKDTNKFPLTIQAFGV